MAICFSFHRVFLTGLFTWSAVVSAATVPRPWLQGMALHVEEGASWRMQAVLPAPFLPSYPTASNIPSALAKAPMPSVLIRFKHLRPGLQSLTDLAGGLPSTLVTPAAHGPRAGFYLRQAQAWLQNGKAVLEPLAQREAWVLHYGEQPWQHQAKRHRVGGTAVFVPGTLPGRNKLVLELARLNPFSVGVRSQKVTLEAPEKPPLKAEAIRGLGGVLYLVERPEGLWIFDQQSLVRPVLEDTAERSLGNAPHWCAVALAGCRSTTLASLWIIPQLAADKSCEDAFAQKPKAVHPLPPDLSASPRQACLSLALGGGPVAALVQAATEADEDESTWSDDPAFKAAHRDLAQALACLRPDTLNLSWFGWTTPPKTKDADPGLTPSVAMALPLQPGKEATLERLLTRLLPKLFGRKAETRTSGSAKLVRIRTEQAFTPTWTLVKDHLVVGFSDAAVEAVAQGLLGQAPTLADAPPPGWGAAALDGPRLSRTFQALLQAYLAAHAQRLGFGEKATADEVAAEVATTFGPFLGALEKLGPATLRLSWKPSGLELEPLR